MKPSSQILLDNTEHFELLEAIGATTQSHLAKLKPDALLSEMEKANDMLQLSEVLPNISTVTEWINRARIVCQLDEIEPEASSITADKVIQPMVEETSVTGNTEKLLKHLENAPFSIPLPELSVPYEELPLGISLNEPLSESEIRTECRVNPAQLVPRNLNSNSSANRGAVNEIGFGKEQKVVEKVEIDISKIKSFESYSEKHPTRNARQAANHAEVTSEHAFEIDHSSQYQSHKKPKETKQQQLTLLRTTLESTNRGVNPESRRYIRGILHSEPFHVYFGSFFTAMLALSIPIAVICTALIMLGNSMPKNFPAMPHQLVIVPISSFVFGLGYLLLGLTSKCKVCGQGLYFPKNCLKHKSAHQLPLIGNLASCALHAVIFRWFRCSYCGTALRLKK